MQRREFITLIDGSTFAWSLVARAQQPGMPAMAGGDLGDDGILRLS
jgi:hypothetical protein